MLFEYLITAKICRRFFLPVYQVKIL